MDNIFYGTIDNKTTNGIHLYEDGRVIQIKGNRFKELNTGRVFLFNDGNNTYGIDLNEMTITPLKYDSDSESALIESIACDWCEVPPKVKLTDAFLSNTDKVLFNKIYSNNYVVRDSTIYINGDFRLMLNLTLDGDSDIMVRLGSIKRKYKIYGVTTINIEHDIFIDNKLELYINYDNKLILKDAELTIQ